MEFISGVLMTERNRYTNWAVYTLVFWYIKKTLSKGNFDLLVDNCDQMLTYSEERTLKL